MRLGLSSAAAADADIVALLAACARRGLGVLELCDEDDHGVSDGSTARAASVVANDFGVEIAAYRVTRAPDAAAIADIAAGLDAPALLAHGALSERIQTAGTLVHAGARAVVEVRGPAASWVEAIEGSGVDVAWQIDESVADMAGDVQHAMRAIPERLRYVRLLGGGPEAAMAEGRGIGPLMGRLALERYGGPLILAPSSRRYRVAWEAWLGRRGGWGCGSRADREVVQLAPATVER